MRKQIGSLSHKGVMWPLQQTDRLMLVPCIVADVTYACYFSAYCYIQA